MCGIIGILAPSGQQARQQIYDGLLVLQHRGQDAAGIVTCDGERFHQRKSNGLVGDVFRQSHMDFLGGPMGIGHVRYPTAGGSSSAEAQPFYTNSPYGMALAHNGNLTNAQDLLHDLIHHDRRHVNTSSDSEVLLNILATELERAHATRIEGEIYLDCGDLFDAVERVHARVEGSYAAVTVLSGYGILAFRDPLGIRPLIHGVREDENGSTHVFASESVVLTALGCEIVSDVAPGEAVFVDENGRDVEFVIQNPVSAPVSLSTYISLVRIQSLMGYQYTNPESRWVNASQSKFWQNTPIMKSMQLCRFQIAEESLQWKLHEP